MFAAFLLRNCSVVKASFIEQLQENVIKVLAHIRPTLQRDGGDAEFVGIGQNQVVQIRMTGAFPVSRINLKEGIEKFVKNKIPTIRAVEAVE